MILIVGDLRESGLALIISRLIERGDAFAFVDMESEARDCRVAWTLEDGCLRGSIAYGSDVVDLGAVRAAFIAHMPRVSSRGLESIALLAEIAPFFVCSRPSADATNFSKVLQQRTISAQGFVVPRTLVTNDPLAVREFFAICRKRVIYKSISSWRSVVKRLAEEDLARLPLLSSCPTQFQEWIPGKDVRVHVVEDAVFATEIDSASTDYRYGAPGTVAPRMRAVELPVAVRDDCRELARTLRMPLAGIDLRRSITGTYYCFEANPSPGFGYYQQFTGQPIADAVLAMLLRHMGVSQTRI